MLKVTHHTPNKLILKDQRHWAGIGALVFTLISLGAFIIFMAQIGSIIQSQLARNGMLWAMVVVIFFCLIGGLVVVGGIATWHLWYGVHCILDRDTETLSMKRIGFVRPIQTDYPIYAIERVMVEINPEMPVYGVFFSFKDGKSLPFASFYAVDEDAMKDVIQQIYTFLRG